MKQIKTNNQDNTIMILLESLSNRTGTYIDANNASIDALERMIDKNLIVSTSNTVLSSDIISTPLVLNDVSSYDDIISHFNQSVYFITGTTTSKYSALKKSLYEPLSTPGRVKMVGNTDGIKDVILESDSPSETLKKRIKIMGTEIVGMLLKEDIINGIYEYVLYLDTPFPIKYIDLTPTLTIFKFMRDRDMVNTNANLSFYDLIEEPKILSEVFIDRGSNNVFETIKKLKKVKTLNELTKTGMGFFKVNTKGFNFKNL